MHRVNYFISLSILFMKIGDENIEKIVLDRTKELLTRYGIKGWNMDDLAQESGMSKRTLYKIIGNKEDLLYKCYHDDFEANTNSLNKYLNQDLSYFDLLDNLPEQIIAGVGNYVISASKSMRTEYPRISAMIENKVQENHNILKAFFEKIEKEGYLKENANTKITINFINALMSYNVLNSKDKTEFELKVKEELDFLFMAIRKS